MVDSFLMLKLLFISGAHSLKLNHLYYTFYVISKEIELTEWRKT